MADDKIKALEKKLAELRSQPEGEEGVKKVDVLNLLAFECHRSELEKTKKYASEARELARKLDYQRGFALSHTMLGLYYKGIGDYDEGVEYSLEALKLFEVIEDQKGIASACRNLGNIYLERNDFEHALKRYHQSLGICEKINDQEGAATSYNNIGLVFQKKGDLKKGLNFFNKALKIREAVGDKQWVASTLNNIGNVHIDLGDYDQALQYQEKALKFRQEVGDKNGIAYSYSDIGLIRFKQEHHDLALECFEKGLKLAREIGVKNLEMGFYQQLTGIYEAQEDYKESFGYYKKYSELKAEIFSEESSEKIARLRLRYESEQKEKEAEIFKLKNEELEQMVAERTAKLEAQIAERRHAEDELKEKLTLIDKQRASILELSTPVIKIWEGVLVIPLIGALDTRRSQRLTEELLASIGDTQSAIAIIDITGVPTVDSAVANHLLKTASSVRLMGAECVITGIRPEVAQTIIHLGIDLSNIETLSTLAEGLKWAFKSLRNVK